MLRSSRVVKLMKSGLEARISVMSKNDLSGVVSYIYSESEKSFQIQMLYSFCENYLTGIIPNLIGKDKEFRETVFEELYQAIVELNPELSKITNPLKGTGTTYQVSFIAPAKTKKQNSSKKKSLVVSKDKVNTLAKALGKKVYGQSEVLGLIQEYFECSLAGIADDSRPRGAFIFVGDTGTGKTMCVKEIAKHFWGERWRDGLYVINGSEMMEEHETARLLGSPQGYVGYEDGSPFLKHVSTNAESIILVDEFEKAHPKMQDIFLQILEEGFCHDNKGNRVDFSKTFIIFTSNIGTKEFYHKNPLGFGSKNTDNVSIYINSAVSKFCRVEFIKRFDGIVIFNTLGKDSKIKIAKSQVDELRVKLKDKGFRLDVESNIYDIMISSLSEADTSRDIRTIVKKQIGTPIAKLLLSDQDFDTVSVAYEDSKIIVRGVSGGQADK